MGLLVTIREFYLPFIVFLFINIVTIFFAKRKFGTCIPFTMIFSVIILYFSQLIAASFLFGMGLLLLAGVSGLFLLLWKWKEMKSLFFTNGMIAFVAVCFLFAIIDYHRSYYDFDEFWHWGMMVKETLRLDSFYCVQESNLIIHKDYPPFLAIWEALWCKIVGRYSEGGVTTAIHVFAFSLLIPPFLEKLVLRKETPVRIFVKAIFFSITIFLLIACFDVANTENTILADIPVAIVFAYAMLLIMTGECYESGFGLVRLVAALIAVLMVKQVGMAMFLVVILAYIVFWLYGNRGKLLLAISSIALVVLVPYGVYYSWTSYVKRLGVSDIRSSAGGNGQFDLGKVDVRQYLDAVTGKTKDLRAETFKKLLQAFCRENVADLPAFSITYVSAFVLIVVVLCAFVYRFRKDFPRKKAILLGGIFFVGKVGFACMLSATFLFCFVEDEMRELRGYGRYVDSFLVGEVLLLFFLYALYENKQDSELKEGKKSRLFLGTAVLAILLNAGNINNLVPQAINENIYKGYEEIAATINKNVPENARVGVVSFNGQYGPSWYAQCFLQYYSNDKAIALVDFGGIDMNDSSAAERFWQAVQNYDYLYIGDLNESAEIVLGEKDPVRVGGVYSIQ